MARGRFKNMDILTKMETDFLKHWQGDSIEAARKAGYTNPRSSVPKLLRKPIIVKHIKKIQDQMSKAAGDKLGKASKVSRDWIIDRLAELASLEAEDTNGTITGQVSALRELDEIFGMKVKQTADVTDQLKTKTKDELRFIREYGREPVDPDELRRFALSGSSVNSSKAN